MFGEENIAVGGSPSPTPVYSWKAALTCFRKLLDVETRLNQFQGLGLAETGLISGPKPLPTSWLSFQGWLDSLVSSQLSWCPRGQSVERILHPVVRLDLRKYE